VTFFWLWTTLCLAVLVALLIPIALTPDEPGNQ
jgi:hypothetical protein